MYLRAGLMALLLSLMVTPGARAADLSGGCCADLEERVAELEAITAHKGNRKMSVVVYGQVDKMYMWESASWSAFKGAPGGSFPSQHGLADNVNAPSLLGVTGEAKLDKNFLAGFRIEIEVDSRQTDAFTHGLASGSGSLHMPPEWQAAPTIRVATGWIGTPVGKVTLGHGSLASDMTGQVSVANTVVASKMLSIGPGAVVLLGFDLPFNDVRRDSVRYDSPTILGFLTISGSIANGDTTSPFTFLTPVATGTGLAQKQAWDIAARAAYEFKELGGIRMAAAISYRNEDGSLFITPAPEDSVTQGSVSVMHLATGAFVNFAYGRVGGIGSSFAKPFATIDMDMWQVQPGWEKNVFKIGATTAFAEYGDISFSASNGTTATKFGFINGNEHTTFWGLGLVQSIDALATDVYLDYKDYSVGAINACGGKTATSGCSPVAITPDLSGQVFMGGMRIKF